MSAQNLHLLKDLFKIERKLVLLLMVLWGEELVQLLFLIATILCFQLCNRIQFQLE